MPWSDEEVRMLYEKALEEEYWVQQAVWIAAHIGARESAISKLQYDETNIKTILFPKMKMEPFDRLIPAHPAIRSNLLEWIKDRNAPNTISNQISGFNNRLAFEKISIFMPLEELFQLN